MDTLPSPAPPALPQLTTAEVVYNDSLARAWRAEHAALPTPVARRRGLSNRAQLPDAEALSALVQVRRGGNDAPRTVARLQPDCPHTAARELGPRSACGQLLEGP